MNKILRKVLATVSIFTVLFMVGFSALNASTAFAAEDFTMKTPTQANENDRVFSTMTIGPLTTDYSQLTFDYRTDLIASMFIQMTVTDSNGIVTELTPTIVEDVDGFGLTATVVGDFQAGDTISMTVMSVVPFDTAGISLYAKGTVTDQTGETISNPMVITNFIDIIA